MMSEKYKFKDPEGLYFTTSTIVFWIDIFTRKEFKHIIIDALCHCHEHKGLRIHARCLMPSHLHLVISSQDQSLSAIMRDFKKFTAKALITQIELINESRKDWLLRAFKRAGKDLKRINDYKVWQDGNQPKQIETNHFLDQKLDYIHLNPVESEIVDEPEQYLFSSARDYAGIKGLLPVDLLE